MRPAGQLSTEPDAEKKAKAEQLDGGYLLRTDRTELTAAEAWLMYMTLTRAESAFRAIKTPLAERPIFHHLEHRVETHIFLCVLAYHLMVAIETTLLNQGIHTSWATVREQVASHSVATMVLPTDGGKTSEHPQGDDAGAGAGGAVPLVEHPRGGDATNQDVVMTIRTAA